MFDKVLVANRGEIAIRVMRACRELGIGTVAVYSEADADAPHVRYADEAVHIGPAKAAESYLVMEKHIDAAQDLGAEAIHPGYGFLAENADFAEAVQDAGLAFVGPDPEPMRKLGNKVMARKAAQAAGVPVSAGTDEAVSDPEEVQELADEVGYPLMIKAAAGGGGIGMRIAESEDELGDKLEAAQRQAESAFGDPSVFVERFLTHPRHIEVQVIGDQHGNVVHLGERECSIQRRHQKLIEEAPSSLLTPEDRAWLGERAVTLASDVGYHNAGTLEFLYQEDLGDTLEERFNFMEVNTRLQVEHTCTEMVTGVDLVKEQLRVASGEELSFTQDDVTFHGHSIECRINAEDPASDFRPAPGHIRSYEPPEGPFVRVDDGVEADFTMPGDYDSLMGKLLTWGSTRLEATDRMLRALREYEVQGPPNVIPFHQRVMEDEAWRSGDLTTRFLEERPVLQELKDAEETRQREARLRAIAVAAALTRAPGGGVRGIVHRKSTKRVDDDATGPRTSPWVLAGRNKRGW